MFFNVFASIFFYFFTPFLAKTLTLRDFPWGQRQQKKEIFQKWAGLGCLRGLLAPPTPSLSLVSFLVSMVRFGWDTCETKTFPFSNFSSRLVILKEILGSDFPYFDRQRIALVRRCSVWSITCRILLFSWYRVAALHFECPDLFSDPFQFDHSSVPFPLLPYLHLNRTSEKGWHSIRPLPFLFLGNAIIFANFAITVTYRNLPPPPTPFRDLLLSFHASKSVPLSAVWPSSHCLLTLNFAHCLLPYRYQWI